MKTGHKRALIGVAIAALGAGVATLYYGAKLAAIGTAYTAKILCSGVFVAHRDPRSVLGTDLSADDLHNLRHIDARVDQDSREVTANLFGIAERKAIYREGLGCFVGQDDGVKHARMLDLPSPPADRLPAGDDLRIASGLPPEVDEVGLQRALDWAFSEPDPALPRRTRAVIVLYKGQLIAERYAEGFTRDTPLIGWSMTKSVVNALVGVLVKDGRLSLDDPVLISEWQGTGDPRRNITLTQLLRMTSGLQFEENYANPLADVTVMLFGVPGAASFAVAKPLEAEPGTRWSYSSGTTNILSHAIRQTVGEPDYQSFPRRALFDRIGMASAVLETDAAGTFVGSSFMYATARDWARFGLLYLQDGVWSGERILPDGWVTYSRTPAPGAPDGQFGAHFWLRVPKEFHCADDTPDLPADAFHAIGHEGQFVTIIPSRSLVLVRLGFTHYPCAWDHPQFVQRVLNAVGLEGGFRREASP